MSSKPRLVICLIVKNEEEVLERCLASAFQVSPHIVVVDTGSTDKTIDIAKRLGAHVESFTWVDDFSAARNYSFQVARQVFDPEYLMWLDADDVVTAETARGIDKSLSEGGADIFIAPYLYASDEHGNPIVTVMRERIIRSSLNPRWEGAIHECVPISGNTKIVEWGIKHARPLDRSPNERNLRIYDKILKERGVDGLSARDRYYYARELSDGGRFDDALSMFERFVNSHDAWWEDKAQAFCSMARLAGRNNVELGRRFAAQAAAVKHTLAEAYCIIGDLCVQDRQWDAAIHWYNVAASVSPGKDMLGSINEIYHTWQPHIQLCKCYTEKGALDKAREHLAIAERYRPNDPAILHSRAVLNPPPPAPAVPAPVVQAPAKPLSVGWFIPESRDFGPVRIRGMNVSRTMRALGYDAPIVTEHDLATRMFDLLIVGHYWHDGAFDAVDAYKARTGGKVVADFAEDYFSLNSPNLDRMLAQADAVVCCSTTLAEKARARGKQAFVIEDGIETPKETRAHPRQTELGGRLKAGWLGYGGGAKHAEALRPLLDQLGYDLVTIHEWPNATIPWDLDTCFTELSRCDIVICPQAHELQPCKSANKLTQAMGLALPAVVSPLPAYLEVIKPGETGFVASTSEEWEQAFRALRDDDLRARIAEAAYQAAEPYRLEAIAEKWAAFAKSLTKRASEPTPDIVVDIIVPTFNNPDLLALCVRTLVESTDIPYRVIVVDNGERKADHEALRREVVRGACIKYDVIVPPSRLTFSESNNVALKESKAPYVCLLNDDTIPTPGWLSELKAAADEGYGIVGPFSNCDQGWLHHEQILVDGVDLHPGMKLAEVAHIIPNIQRYGAERSRSQPVTNKWRWFAFYCVLMKREVIEKVGLLDTTFLNGGEDADYCYRAARLGIGSAQRMNSFVFHFGGQSRKLSEQQDPDRHHREDKFNNEYLQKKWEKKTLVFYTGPAWERWSPRSLTEGGIGGSETAVIHMARELSSRYRVVVFNDCRDQAGHYDGVLYRPYTEFPTFVEQNWIDVLVASRTLEPFRLPVRAGRKLCWVHDIWLGQANALPAEHSQVDAFLCLSDWHKEFFCAHHGVDPARVRVTRNGIDLGRFSQGPMTRDRYRFIYSSSPDRGLDVLLGLWPKILEIAPQANLRVFYGFDNWNKSIEAHGNADQAAFRDLVLAGLKQPGIEVFGRVSQDRLAQEMMQASVWAYPTHFWETFCITALEAQAAGLAVVTSDLAGLKDSVKVGVRVPVKDYWQSWTEVHGPEYQAAFLGAVERALHDEGVVETARRGGPEASRSSAWKHEVRPSSFTWADVANAWVSMFLG